MDALRTQMDTGWTVRCLVHKLGGPRKVAQEIGATEGSVKQWRYSGRIPYQWRNAVKRLAQRRRLELTKQERELIFLPD